VVGTESLAWYVAGAACVLAMIAVGLGLALISVSIASRARRAPARLPSKRLRAALEARRAGFDATDGAFAALGARRGRLAVSWLLLLGAWLVETGETYLLCRLVGIDLDIRHALAMEAAVVFARNAAFFVPAGLGIQDAGYLAFLSAFGIAAPLAAAFVVVKRTKELVWIAIGYLVLLVLERRQPHDAATTVSVAAPLGAGLGGPL
jgi:glycosyltransferase 2 family protein